jgi:phage terminase large subunit
MIESAIKLSDLIGDSPGQTQLGFVLDPARENAWVGGFGCGKTVGLVAKAICHAVRYPRANVLLCRLTYDEMQNTTKKTFFEVGEILVKKQLVERPSNWDFHESTNVVRLVNGSTINFKNLEDPTRRYKNYELSFCGIDQGEENEFEVFEILNNRLRPSLSMQHIPLSAFQMCVIANDDGYNWIYERYHPSMNKDTVRRHFYHASSMDNPHLSREYLEQLLDNSPEWVDRNVHAKMRKDQGRLLLDPQTVSQFTPPANDPVYVGIDHGESSICSAHWGWYNQSGRVVAPGIPPGFTVVFRELWAENTTVDHNSREIVRLSEGVNVISRVMDRSAFRLTQSKKGGIRNSVADVYADCGLFVAPSLGDPDARIKRYNLVASRGLIVTQACPNLLRQIPKYHTKLDPRTGSRDIVKRSTFHAIDSVGYLLMSMPRPFNQAMTEGPELYHEDGVPTHLQPGISKLDEPSRQFAINNYREIEEQSLETVPFQTDLNADDLWGENS